VGVQIHEPRDDPASLRVHPLGLATDLPCQSGTDLPDNPLLEIDVGNLIPAARRIDHAAATN
jgi:hypothetical protein